MRPAGHPIHDRARGQQACPDFPYALNGRHHTRGTRYGDTRAGWRRDNGIVGRMQVTFAKTGERTYSIAARRPGGDVLHMPRGPGYDPWLPHDLVHFVVERHFGIACGVFGQLAAGGDAGTFFTIPHRRRDPARRLSARLGALGREDTARSERLAAACMAAWHARHRGRWEFGAPSTATSWPACPRRCSPSLTRWRAAGTPCPLARR